MRGYAILGVILIHTSQCGSPTSRLLSAIVENGSMGVTLFYMTSALTLMLSMTKRSGEEQNSLSHFYLRRLFRIAPMFWLGVLVYGSFPDPAEKYWAPNGISAIGYGLTLIFLHGWHPELINAVVPGGWSIAVEVTFYMCFPIIFRLCNTVRRTVWAVLLSGIICRLSMTVGPSILQLAGNSTSPGYLTVHFFYLWFFGQLPVFFLGMLLYHLLFGELQYHATGVNDGRLFLCLFALGAFAALQLNTTANIIPKHIVFGGLFVCFGAGLYRSGTGLVNPVVTYVGRLSYSMYLTHWLALRVVKGNLRFAEGDATFLVRYVLVLSVTLLISTVTYHLIEKPGIRVGIYVIKALGLRKASLSAEPSSLQG